MEPWHVTALDLAPYTTILFVLLIALMVCLAASQRRP
jgi:biopolymer transport protein ExbD